MRAHQAPWPKDTTAAAPCPKDTRAPLEGGAQSTSREAGRVCAADADTHSDIYKRHVYRDLKARRAVADTEKKERKRKRKTTCVCLSIMTPPHKSAKAIRVPTDVISAKRP